MMNTAASIFNGLRLANNSQIGLYEVTELPTVRYHKIGISELEHPMFFIRSYEKNNFFIESSNKEELFIDIYSSMFANKSISLDNDHINLVQHQISQWKNAFISPDQASANATEEGLVAAAKMYQRYQQTLNLTKYISLNL